MRNEPSLRVKIKLASVKFWLFLNSTKSVSPDWLHPKNLPQIETLTNKMDESIIILTQYLQKLGVQMFITVKFNCSLFLFPFIHFKHRPPTRKNVRYSNEQRISKWYAISVHYSTFAFLTVIIGSEHLFNSKPYSISKNDGSYQNSWIYVIENHFWRTFAKLLLNWSISWKKIQFFLNAHNLIIFFVE